MTLSQLWLWFISSFRFWWYICIPNFRQPCIDTYFEAATCRTCKRATQYGNITISPLLHLDSFPYFPPHQLWDLGGDFQIISKLAPPPPPVDSLLSWLRTLTSLAVPCWLVQRKLEPKAIIWFMVIVRVPSLISAVETPLQLFRPPTWPSWYNGSFPWEGSSPTLF